MGDLCYGTITPFALLMEVSHDATLVLQPSLRQIPSKGFWQSLLCSLAIRFVYEKDLQPPGHHVPPFKIAAPRGNQR